MEELRLDNGKLIQYDLVRKKVKNINLRIRNDGSIRVSANPKVPLDLINDFIRARSSWILENQERLARRYEENKLICNYRTGDRVRYLGEELVLDFIRSDREGLTLDGESLVISLEEKDFEDLEMRKKLLDNWYEAQAEVIFHQALRENYEAIDHKDIPYPSLKWQKMKSLWGTCRPARREIKLNTVLIKTPRICIDYVIVHELSHFLYRGHGRDFYRQLEEFMPDWEERKNLLQEKYSCELEP